jgi:Tol biopolymer transport system component
MNSTTLILPIICLVLLTVAETTLSSQDVLSDINTKAEQHFEKANQLFKCMDYKGSIAEYEKVVNLASNSEIVQNAQYWIGQSQFRAGRLDDAQATFAKLIEQYPSSTIIPVTKLMIEQVQQAKKTETIRSAMSDTAEKGYIIDPSNGVKYTKVATFAGKNDVIEYRNKLNLSPNGKFLLWQKIVIPIDGSEPISLVDNPDAWGGVWSPDGTKVAFYLPDAISVIPISPETGRPTGPVRKLYEGRYIAGPLLSWSPDGQKLALKKDWTKIWILSVKDGSLTQISDVEAYGEPKWAPDGKTILYGISEYMDGGGSFLSLGTISTDGSVVKKIIAPIGREGSGYPEWYWSRDSRWILYEYNGIHLINIEDKRKFNLAQPPREVGGFFSWSPDGKKMLFYRESYAYRQWLKLISPLGGPPFDIGKEVRPYGAAMWTPDSKTITIRGVDEDGKDPAIWIIPISGGDPVALEIDVSVDGKPILFEVSPMGDKLAFVVDRGDGTRDLYVVPVSLKDARTTGPAVRVFEGWHPQYESTVIPLEASWSPDGTKLAVVHGKDLWTAYSNGDKPVRLAEDVEYPGWSPDGTMVDYVDWPKGDPNGGLCVIPSHAGDPITKILGGWYNRVWSPDSKQVAFESKDSISTITVADSHTREVASLKDLGLATVWYLGWSPDGKYIACDGLGEKGEVRPIILIPVEGGKPTMLATDDDNYKYSLHWSPDGKWIAYRSGGEVKVRPEGSLWETDFDEIVKRASR